MIIELNKVRAERTERIKIELKEDLNHEIKEALLFDGIEENKTKFNILIESVYDNEVLFSVDGLTSIGEIKGIEKVPVLEILETAKEVIKENKEELKARYEAVNIEVVRNGQKVRYITTHKF